MTPLINVFVRWHICRISSCLAWGCFTILIFVCVRVDKKIKMIYIYKYLLIDLFFYKEIAFGGNFDSPHEFFGASMGN